MSQRKSLTSNVRYYAVVHPIQRQVHVSAGRVGWTLTAVWILPCILAAPNAYPALAAIHHLSSEYGEFTRTTCFDRYGTLHDKSRKS